MIDQSVQILYTVTVALQGPVVLAILLALVWVLWETGGFLREWYERSRRLPAWRRALAATDLACLPALLDQRDAPELLRHHAPFLPGAVGLERLLDDLEFAAARRLSVMRAGLRLGPVLGLMGTLIPMGPALMSISQGNLAVMSQDLIIAFSTTVGGLLVGGLCYVMLIVRQYWYARDMALLERLTTPDREPQP